MPRGRGHGPRMSNEKAKDFKGTMKKLMAYLSAYKIGIFFVIVFAIGSTIFNIVFIRTGVYHDRSITEADLSSEKRNLRKNQSPADELF